MSARKITYARTILYARIRNANYQWLLRLAEIEQTSMSLALDKMLEKCRVAADSTKPKANASKAKQSK